MHWFSDLTTRTKLLGAFTAVAIIILGVALVGILGIASLNAGTGTLYSDRLLPVHQLASFNDAQLEIRANLYGSILFPGDRSARERAVAALIASADGSLAQYEATYLVPEEVQGLARLKPAWVAYQQTVARTFGLAESGDVSGALESVAAGGPVSAAEAVLSGVITDLVDIQLRVGVTIKQQGDRTFDAATWAMALAALIGVLLAISLAVVIARSISVPLARITGAARDVADGKLDAPTLADIRSRDEIGVLARTFGFMTGRLRSAQEALRESEERYRRITESITDYVFTVHVDAGQVRLTTHGVGCEPVTGYAPEELTAEPDLRLRMVVADDRQAVLDQAARILEGMPVAPIEHRIVRKDGVQRWVRNTLVPQLGSDGNLVAYDGLVQDITERRTLQDELLEAQKMESIGRLAGGVAHKFNNLLTVILGNAEVVLTELPADHPARSDIEEIVNAGERASGLIRQLLAFASRQVIAPMRLDLSAVVADSEEMLRLLLGEKIEVVTELGSSLDAVEADPGQVQQVLINLVMNARDAMPHGGRLVIETTNETVTDDFAATHAQVSPGRYVRLSVADTGLGMSDEVMRLVFEPFFTTKDLSKGAGLGLASCRGILKQIGGDIRVSSTPGQGTTFRILLPAIGAPAASSPGAASPVRPSTGSETVLVVDDEPSVRRLAVHCLQARGYAVHEAADGFEALEIVSRTPGIELVVSDVVMPGMNGLDLVEQLLRQTPDARVLLMSGYTEAPLVAGNLATRNLAFLAKPFTPEQIVRKVREVLDGATDSDPLTGPQSLPAEGTAEGVAEGSGRASPEPSPGPG